MMSAKARRVLDSLEARDSRERATRVAREQRLRQVTPEVGRFLHTLVLAARPQSIIEIGASGGYSTIWLASAARAVGGSVTTLEIDPVKCRLAKSNLSEAGFTDVVAHVLEGDAFEYLRERREPVDFFFLDAEKEDYPAFLDLIVPLMRVGATLAADNLLSHEEELRPFREKALSDPRLSGIVIPIGREELLAVRVA